MIRYLPEEEIDSGKWDACIRESSPSLLYAYTWYLDVVCSHWAGLVLNDYEAVMPLPYTRKLGLTFGLQPLFCQQLGVFSKGVLDEELLKRFLAAIPPSFLLVNYQLNYRCRQVAGDYPLKNNYVLDLMPDHKTLHTRYHLSLRRGLKKSAKSSCQILEGVDVASMLDLIRYQNTEKKMGLNEKALKTLEKLIHTATAKGVLISVGYYSPVNHLCSVGIFLADRQRIYYLIGASDKMGREYFGMGRVMDHIIQKYSGMGMTLDFEGSEIEGIARFFSHFGAQNNPYPVFLKNRLGAAGRFLLGKAP